MGTLLRFLIGAETLRRLPMPKKLDHLLRRLQMALAAFIAFAFVMILTCVLIIAYIVFQLASGQ